MQLVTFWQHQMIVPRNSVECLTVHDYYLLPFGDDSNDKALAGSGRNRKIPSGRVAKENGRRKGFGLESSHERISRIEY